MQGLRSLVELLAEYFIAKKKGGISYTVPISMVGTADKFLFSLMIARKLL